MKSTVFQCVMLYLVEVCRLLEEPATFILRVKSKLGKQTSKQQAQWLTCRKVVWLQTEAGAQSKSVRTMGTVTE
jgi:hypothetical protein